MRKYLLIGVSAFVLGAGSMAYVSQQALASAQPRTNTYKMLELFGDVLDTVERQYVTEVDDKKLIEAAIDGMLTSLDPHSNYLNPESFDDMRDQTRGEYGGLGIEVTSEDGVVKVISPMDGTPAFKAGIKAGDYITAVNGGSVLGLSVSDAVKQMRGKPGEAVTLTIAREKTDPFDVKLVREVIKTKSATGKLIGDYGYLRVSAFNEKTTDEAEAVITDLRAKNPKIKGWILDLRNNPGGLLTAAVDVSEQFVGNGKLIVYTKGREGKKDEWFSKTKETLEDSPMIILVIEGSASASEIVAGALQDWGRAVIVGTTSFGKGSVQTILPLGDGSGLRLTTAKYYTPKGRSIQSTGITPDIVVKLQAPTVAKAGEKEGKEPEPKVAKGAATGKDAPAKPAEEPAHKNGAVSLGDAAGEISLDDDVQLQKAVELLKTWKIFKELRPAA